MTFYTPFRTQTKIYIRKIRRKFKKKIDKTNINIHCFIFHHLGFTSWKTGQDIQLERRRFYRNREGHKQRYVHLTLLFDSMGFSG